jgi:Ni,Fe-hydrogenase I cytochrome b subunit
MYLWLGYYILQACQMNKVQLEENSKIVMDIITILFCLMQSVSWVIQLAVILHIYAILKCVETNSTDNILNGKSNMRVPEGLWSVPVPE